MTTQTPFSLRLPPSLAEHIRQRAADERRSFSNEVRVLIEAGLGAARSERAFEAELIETFDAREVDDGQ